MTKRPRADDEPALPPDPPPGGDPDLAPRFPKPSQRNRDERPETHSDNTKVTPLDEDKNLENGIEIDER